MSTTGQVLKVKSDGTSLEIGNLPVNALTGGTSGQSLFTNSLNNAVWQNNKWSWCCCKISFTAAQDLNSAAAVVANIDTIDDNRGSIGVGGISTATPVFAKTSATQVTCSYSGLYKFTLSGLELSSVGGGGRITIVILVGGIPRGSFATSPYGVAGGTIQYCGCLYTLILAGEVITFRAVRQGASTNDMTVVATSPGVIAELAGFTY